MNELRPKLFDVMKSYTKKQLIKDIISGIIVAIIALPLSIALAIASGVGPEQGLYTAIIAGFFISFFGGSRVQIGGPTAAFVVIIYGIVASYGTDGLIVATILAGIILVIMGICRFGSLIKYIPYTITTGFTCGIAVTLFIGQLKDFFGMDIASVPSEFLDKVINIDQSPIGRTPRSNPATYTGVFNDIRDLFAETNDAKMHGYTSGRFSFNVKGGRCEACEGDGIIKIEMHFLPDVYVPCEVCKGKRYNRETLEVKYKGKNIYDVLEMTVDEGVEFFSNHPKIYRKLLTLQEVGLGYVKIGQPATTLSGGEAQRVKLAAELSKRSTGKTIYVLDEPTTGLHTADVHKLLEVLERLTDGGNTVLVIEHNLDVIKTADYLIDLGPEGGDKGGTLVCCGTPEEVAACDKSYTGRYLKPMLSK